MKPGSLVSVYRYDSKTSDELLLAYLMLHLKLIKQKEKVSVVIFTFLFFSTLFAHAQEITFQQISLEQGLSQSIVESIIQDNTGFIWLATEDGLNIYDGYEFKVLRNDPLDPYSLSYNHITKLYIDRSGNIWVGTFNGGLNRYSPRTDQFVHYRHNPKDANSLSNDIIHAITEDNMGNLWVGTECGLNMLPRFARNDAFPSFIRYFHDPQNPGSLSSNVVRTIHEDRDCHLWIGTDFGLNRLDTLQNRNINEIQFIHYLHESGNPNSLSNNVIRTIFEDEDSTLWIGTDNGLNRLYRDEKETNFIRQPLNTQNVDRLAIYAIFDDESGNLWIGTNGRGLYIFNKHDATVQHYANEPHNIRSLSYNEIRCIYRDRSGNIWIGTYGGGISKLDRGRKKFSLYKNESGNTNSLPADIIWSVHEDRSGMLWIGTHGGGLSRLDRENNQYTHFRHDPRNRNSLSSDIVRTVMEDRKGRLWIGTHGGGLCEYDKVNAEFIIHKHDPANPQSLSHNEIRSLYEDQRGDLWIGTNGGGLNKFSPDSGNVFHRYRFNPEDAYSLSNNFVRAIHQDSSGIFWIGTQGGGLNRFDPEMDTFRHYRSDNTDNASISSDFVFSIHEDSEGRLWLGTWGGGLNCFSKESEKFNRYTVKNGLSSDAVYGLLEDENGHLWISTNNGLSKFDPRNASFTNFYVEDGLQSNEFNGGAYFKSSRGELFFGGIHGFNSFYPADIKCNEYIPPVVITRFDKLNQEMTFNRRFSEVKEIELSHKDYFFSFNFSALDFTSPDKNQYAYKMEGLDSDWIYTSSNKRYATYTTLSPGSYTFHVRGSNNDGVWNDEGTSIRLIITPPIWKTWWFQMLIILGLISAVLYQYRRRIEQVEAKKRDLEIQIHEKTLTTEALQNALNEVERLTNRLQVENVYLKDEIKLANNFENIITKSKMMKGILKSVEQVSSTDATVLITGESGTGKELIARAIHSISLRTNRALVKVDCAVLPPNLIESELFGHEKGAFTGAIASKIGRFEIADGGTIFLDEIGDLPLELQTKLLRILQDGEFERLGNPKTLKINVRVIAATNRDLEKEICAGRFREDLYYRLHVFPIHLPPLRERKEDIPVLVRHFIQKYSTKTNRTIEAISKSDLDRLGGYSWPGNIRELENVIERAIILTRGKQLSIGDWFRKDNNQQQTSAFPTIEENERLHILKALKMMEWRVSGERGAASLLGINPQTLVSRMKKLNIRRSK